mgnify:CR=1 FL=1
MANKVKSLLGGPGFYAVLALCVLAVGVGGYFLLFGEPAQTEAPTGPDTAASAPVEDLPEHEPVVETVPPEEPEEETEPVVMPEVTIPVDDTPVVAEEPHVVVLPIQGEVLTAFSVDQLLYNETLDDWRTHDGVDIAAAEGDAVLAACAGTVSSITDDPLMGTTVVTQHSGGYETTYANLQAEPAVETGDTVSAGQTIGAVGTTAAAEAAQVPHRFALGPGEDGFADLLADLPRQPDTLDRVETQVTDPLLLYFTSGTTGLPKGVLHDHAFPLANYWGARYMQDVHKGSRHFATGDTGWEVVSGTKFYGQWLLQGTLLVYDYDRFPPEKVLAFLSQARATSIMAQPTVYRLLTQVGMDRYDLSSITNYAVGGEKLPPDLAQTVLAQTGHPLYEGYAQSEAGLIASASQVMGRKEGSVGVILPKYHVEILREDGTFAPPGVPGEIILVADGGRRPEGLMMGYLDDEEANRRLWDGDYFHTGDLATRDADGFLYYLGRSDGIIKTKGYRVSPVEIEEALSRHPAVAECLATGEPDPDLGQKVKVYVTLAPGYAPSPALREALMAFHNEACAGFKKIRDLAFVPALAHNANGKLIRGQFRDPKA